MTTVTETDATKLTTDVIQALDNLSGVHPGFRPAHAKGILLTGTFAPCPDGRLLTRAPHLRQPSTPVTVRFSNSTGIPAIPDNDPNASPRGMATRFHFGEHVHTDIIAHSVNGFPSRTAEEFVELLRAIYASASGASKPTPIEAYLATHPAALAFVQAPKPIPSSFAKESFYAVNAYRFTNDDGIVKHGRFRIDPDGTNEYLDATVASQQTPDFLFDELKERIAQGPLKLRITVQLAEPGDIVDDSTIPWPDDRPKIEFGNLELAGIVGDNAAEQQHIIFDPIPRVDGIDPSADPLLEPRAAVYLASGRRRRAAK